MTNADYYSSDYYLSFGSTEFEIDNALVELTGPTIHQVIKGQDVYFREGTWFERNEDGEFEPDWSLTWFWTDKEHPENYLYFEQDPWETALENLINIMPEPEQTVVYQPVYELETE